jgi:hypothetical protein
VTEQTNNNKFYLVLYVTVLSEVDKLTIPERGNVINDELKSL